VLARDFEKDGATGTTRFIPLGKASSRRSRKRAADEVRTWNLEFLTQG
jgi:hypothetical protein